MENTSNELKCNCCHSLCKESDKFCGNCGYPLHASPEEQKRFSMNFTTHNDDVRIVKDRIREARLILFIIATFTFIQSLLIFINDANISVFAINLILVCVYIYLGVWAKEKAFAAILIGGLIYITFMLLSAFIDPSTIAKGLVIKILFIAALIRTAYGAYKYKV